MNHNPFTRAREYSPYVTAFLAEVSTAKPDKFRIVPCRYLCHLYNKWCETRGGFEGQKMNQQRFSFVLSALGYQKTRKTRGGITCFNVCLLASPKPPLPTTADSLGAESLALFEYPPTSEVPATILNEVTALRHISDLRAREEALELERWTEEERTLPAHVVVNNFPAKKEEPSQEPNVEQIEADETTADASNEYDA